MGLSAAEGQSEKNLSPGNPKDGETEAREQTVANPTGNNEQLLERFAVCSRLAHHDTCRQDPGPAQKCPWLSVE